MRTEMYALQYKLIGTNPYVLYCGILYYSISYISFMIVIVIMIMTGHPLCIEEL